MRIIEPGHVYRVQNVDGPGEQEIRFVRRRDDRGQLLDEFEPGILSQELLRVLIHRVLHLNAEDPCTEDVELVHKGREMLKLFEARAARRTIERLPMPETASACPKCHHILCSCGHPDRLVHEVRR